MERHIVGNNAQNTEEKVAPMTEAKSVPVEQEKSDPYAHMFAEWDLVPPQVVIRRIHRKAQ